MNKNEKLYLKLVNDMFRDLKCVRQTLKRRSNGTFFLENCHVYFNTAMNLN